MLRLSVLSALFAVCLGAATGSGSERIVGGTEVNDFRDVHFVVSITNKYTHICGGAIIAPKYAITAAECIYGLHLIDLKVHSGSKYLGGSSVIHDVAARHYNTYYKPSKKNYNVAILLVTKQFEVYDPVVIPPDINSDESPGWKLMTYGWGVTSGDDGDLPLSTTLNEIEMSVMNKMDCESKYSGVSWLTFDNATMNCLETKSDAGLCRGDYGGPMIDMNYGNPRLIGVTFQSSLYCNNPNFPHIYTKLSAVRKWITTIAGV